MKYTIMGLIFGFVIGKLMTDGTSPLYVVALAVAFAAIAGTFSYLDRR